MCCQAVSKHMLQKRRGMIINIASVTGMIESSVKIAAYSAAKAGIIVFTNSWAKELGPYGIKINCILPGSTATPYFFKFEKEVVKKPHTFPTLRNWEKVRRWHYGCCPRHG